jgi:Fe2+ transport system protein B
MSCAARLPVYVLIAGAFFAANAATAVWAMYIIGHIRRHTLRIGATQNYP